MLHHCDPGGPGPGPVASGLQGLAQARWKDRAVGASSTWQWGGGQGYLGRDTLPRGSRKTLCWKETA